ncbi:serine/arginine repetitive matrix protein 1 [Amphiprion ocellaris]|uniref:Uncharacterized protein n=1 Tax=Amphiprion ocellaris TaxID=80972 RepID=A0AAQ5Y8K5_AMPOC|nr:serine/arginine repetitive matrix protein 1 [Amphiprion ocellaris]
MPTTKLIKPKPVEAKKKSPEGGRPGRSGPEGQLQVAAVRKSRASSCPKSQKPKPTGDTSNTSNTLLQGSSSRTRTRSSSRTRTRSSSTAPRGTQRSPRTNPDCRRASSAVRQAAVNPKHRELTPAQREQRGEARSGGQSHKAFTVIPPNPKRRREIQRKAEAELAALEELRLSRAMSYVSINPSSVGGCMSLEEVRLKQQQEMMQAKRKLKPVGQIEVKQQVMEETSILTS